MFRFENPEILFLLIAIPIFAILFIYNQIRKKRILNQFATTNLLGLLLQDYSAIKPIVKFSIWMLVFASLVIALANPQIGSKIEKVKREGIEIIFVLDVSNSMLSNDIPPSRLERAKSMLNKLIDGLISDKVGLVVFAGDAFLQMPLTTDYSAAKLMISSASTDLIGLQGTAIGQALELSVNSLSKNKKVSKVILLISDGENHEDDAVTVAKEAAKQGIQIYTIGMGTPNGGPIPIGNNAYLKDSEGNIVISRLSADILTEIASAGKGKFIYGSAKFTEIESFLNEVAKLDKKELEDIIYTEYDSKYYIFLWIALILFLIDFAILERRSPILSKISIFRG